MAGTYYTSGTWRGEGLSCPQAELVMLKVAPQSRPPKDPPARMTSPHRRAAVREGKRGWPEWGSWGEPEVPGDRVAHTPQKHRSAWEKESALARLPGEGPTPDHEGTRPGEGSAP